MGVLWMMLVLLMIRSAESTKGRCGRFDGYKRTINVFIASKANEDSKAKARHLSRRQRINDETLTLYLALLLLTLHLT